MKERLIQKIDEIMRSMEYNETIVNHKYIIQKKFLNKDRIKENFNDYIFIKILIQKIIYILYIYIIYMTLYTSQKNKSKNKNKNKKKKKTLRRLASAAAVATVVKFGVDYKREKSALENEGIVISASGLPINLVGEYNSPFLTHLNSLPEVDKKRLVAVIQSGKGKKNLVTKYVGQYSNNDSIQKFYENILRLLAADTMVIFLKSHEGGRRKGIMVGGVNQNEKALQEIFIQVKKKNKPSIPENKFDVDGDVVDDKWFKDRLVAGNIPLITKCLNELKFNFDGNANAFNNLVWGDISKLQKTNHVSLYNDHNRKQWILFFKNFYREKKKAGDGKEAGDADGAPPPPPAGPGAGAPGGKPAPPAPEPAKKTTDQNLQDFYDSIETLSIEYQNIYKQYNKIDEKNYKYIKIISNLMISDKDKVPQLLMLQGEIKSLLTEVIDNSDHLNKQYDEAKFQSKYDWYESQYKDSHSTIFKKIKDSFERLKRIISDLEKNIKIEFLNLDKLITKDIEKINGKKKDSSEEKPNPTGNDTSKEKERYQNIEELILNKEKIYRSPEFRKDLKDLFETIVRVYLDTLKKHNDFLNISTRGIRHNIAKHFT